MPLLKKKTAFNHLDQKLTICVIFLPCRHQLPTRDAACSEANVSYTASLSLDSVLTDGIKIHTFSPVCEQIPRPVSSAAHSLNFTLHRIASL